MPENDSSSLNAKLFPALYTVLGVRFNRTADRVTLSLSHDEKLILPADLYTRGKIREGSTISKERLIDFKKSEELLRVKQKAVQLLEFRPLTAVILRTKLRERMYSSEAIDKVVDELTEKGFLDDQKYAENWVVSQLKKKPVGRGQLLRGLLGKGVDRKEAERLLGTVYSPEDEAGHCEKMLAKLLRMRPGLDAKKILPALARRGFGAQIIKKIYEQYKKKTGKE